MSDPPVDQTERTSTRDTPVTVAGERSCPACGYSLLGQSIVREPHYSMLIIRCPECAAVTSVLEYPRLAHWSRALGAIGMAVWLLLLLGATVGSTMILTGMTIHLSETAGHDYAYHLNNLHQVVVDAELLEQQAQAQADAGDGDGDGDESATDPPTAVAPIAPAAPNPSGIVQLPDGTVIFRGAVGAPGATAAVPSADFNVWWATQDPATVLADAGGWMNQVDLRALLILIPLAVVIFAVGCFWSVALIFASPRWLLGWIVFLAFLALIFVTFVWWDWTVREQYWDFGIARAEIGRRVVWFVYLLSLLPLIAGALAGRMLARLLVRALLPPSWRAPLAFMWTHAGKRAPV